VFHRYIIAYAARRHKLWQESRQRGRQEMALKMKDLGRDMDTIAKVTGFLQA
jgi:hypothetical protein